MQPNRLAILVLVLLLSACGGGGGSDSSFAPQAATVGVALTDAPSLDVDQALATITSIQLLGKEGPVTLFAGEETVDLLKLGDFSELFAVRPDVPSGTYSKVRLQLSRLELVRLDDAGQVVETITPKLVANGKLDLNPHGSFHVDPGATLVITVDFDVEKSLKITTTDNGRVIVRPVVFVDIANGMGAPGLTRIHGVVSNREPDGSFSLCQTRFVASPRDDEGMRYDDHCVRVQTDGDTGVFGTDGLPQSLLSLDDGEPATVIGRLRPRLLDDRDEDRFRGDHLGLDAYIIEEGPLSTFRRLAGLVTTPVSLVTDRFEVDLAPGQGIVADTALPVQLYPGSRIFNRRGEERSRDDLVTGTPALSDTVLALAGDGSAVLRSPLVVIQDAAPGELALRGQILTVNAGTGLLNISTPEGDRCVTASTADVFLVEDNGQSFDSQRGSLADLAPGQPVNVFGREGLDGCVVADTILADVDD